MKAHEKIFKEMLGRVEQNPLRSDPQYFIQNALATGMLKTLLEIANDSDPLTALHEAIDQLKVFLKSTE